MSNILRRPMFRGGRVDSRGTGITSGLGYAGGGQIGGGTIYGNPMPDGRYGFANPQPANMALFLANQAKGIPSISAPITGGSLTTKLLPQSFLTGMEGLGALTRSSAIPLTIAGAPFYIFGDEDPLKDKPEEQQLQETATKLTQDFLGQPRKKLMEDIVSGTKSKAESPYTGFDMSAAERESKAAEQKYFLDKNKRSPLATSTEEDLAFATGVPIERTKGDETITGGATGNVISAESGDITLDDYIRMLGGDKARQRDIGDLLGRLSAAALKRPGRGEQRGIADVLGDFMTAEVAAGPGRREKIEQTAAMLDIKDKIESKRSKENIKQLMGMEIFKNQLTAKNLAANITDAKKTGEGSPTTQILDGIQRTFTDRIPKVAKENLPPVTEKNIGEIYLLEKTVPMDGGKGTKTARYVVEIIKDELGQIRPKPLYITQ
jgi:hypothetical protein